jgi:hypothetical protein
VESGIDNLEVGISEVIPTSEFSIADSTPNPAPDPDPDPERERATQTAMKTVAALEQFLDAIHVPRT